MSRPPEWPDTLHVQASEGWLSLRNWQEAKAELDKITDEKVRAHPVVLKAYADVWEVSEDHAAMARYMEVLILYEPDEIDHRLRMNAALLASGRAQEALERIDRDLKDHPDHPGLLFKRAVTLCMLDKLEEAEWALVFLFTLEDGKYEKTYLDIALDWPQLEPLRGVLQAWKRELDEKSGGAAPPEATT